MSPRLSTRLSLFFLGALAVVLVGFSATLYLTASTYLYRQADERLEAALNTLAAAAEVGPGGVEWEPHERSLSFGRRTLEGAFAWRITDALGRRLDGTSPAPEGTDRLFDWPPPPHSRERHPRSVDDRSGTTWRVARRRLAATAAARSDPAQPDEPEGTGVRHPAIEISAAVSLDGVRATLRNLALLLAGLSLGVSTLALLFGRRLCRRALLPVAEMAAAAHAIGGDDPGRRLPVPPADDELGELGRSFNALLDRLQESFERQRRFTGDASHQLRTPLTAMLGQVDLALRQGRTAEEYHRTLTLVQRKARHLRQIIEALLFLARADAESDQPPLDTLDLPAWLDRHLLTWHDPQRTADLRLELEPGVAEPLLVRAQPALLGELVNNLLDNAAKYSEPGTPIVVRVGRVSEGDAVRLAVQDRGVGIDGDDLPRVFEPFFRSPDARRRGPSGLGLGLSVALRLARSFGGTIALTSRSGVGSTFTVTFPSEPTPASAGHSPRGSALGAATAP